MKFKSIISSVVLVAASILFISVAPAQAGGCSAEDPCQTYAMVDDAGVVTNIIVCQPSVCGSGEFAGSRVVPQVAANPVTHESQGGYLNVNGSPVTENNGRFTITNNQPTVSQTLIQEQSTNTILESAIGPGVQSSFTFDDTIGTPNGIPSMKTENMKNSTSATLSVTEINNSDTTTVFSKESITFNERKTEEFVQLQLQIDALERILRSWSWFRTTLKGWFI
jgi:hypothetical protein